VLNHIMPAMPLKFRSYTPPVLLLLLLLLLQV
jgi:hypothetical protein